MEGEYTSISGELFAVVAACVAAAVFMCVCKRGGAGVNKRRMTWQYLYVLYFILVAAVTQFPLYFGMPSDGVSVNFVPAYYIVKSLETAMEYGWLPMTLRQVAISVGANIVMFLPLGILSGLLYPMFLKLRNILILGVGVSLLIETLQLLGSLAGLMQMRVFDVNDIICNTVGALIGCGVLRCCLKTKWGQKLQSSVATYTKKA